MLRHPEMQHKAQTEIDIALGVGVTPTFTDRASLPYCEALYKEVFRVYMSNAGALGKYVHTSVFLILNHFIQQAYLMRRRKMISTKAISSRRAPWSW